MNIKFYKEIIKKDHIDSIPDFDLLSEIHKMISGKVSENYDDLVFSMLEQFGITKDNWRENVGRVTIVDTASDPWTKHFYIDGGYRFSIVEQPGELVFDDEKCEYGMRINYKVKVYEDMLGE